MRILHFFLRRSRYDLPETLKLTFAISQLVKSSPLVMGGATAKSTSLSKQLVDGKRRLETTLDLLINRVTMETSRLKQLRKAKKTIGSPWFNSNEANGIQLTVAQKVRLSVRGKFYFMQSDLSPELRSQRRQI